MKTVIEMAREAGFVLIKSEWVYVDMLERFAELVRADEREACERVAGIALLGADLNLAKRVLRAIRARSNT